MLTKDSVVDKVEASQSITIDDVVHDVIWVRVNVTDWLFFFDGRLYEYYFVNRCDIKKRADFAFSINFKNRNITNAQEFNAYETDMTDNVKEALDKFASDVFS